MKALGAGSLAILLLGAPPASRKELEGHAGRATSGVDALRHYVELFNADDQEGKPGYVDNRSAGEWLENNIPFFECSDKALEEMYYFRWWTYRKHIKQTPEGFVVTEFLPDVPWAGKHNTISAAAAHHFYEGRWLRDRKYLADYARFWFRGGGAPRLYSFAAADALRAWSLVTQDQRLTADLSPDLVDNYREWEASHRDPNGLFWQIDDRDGMEFSIGGSGYRPTINSYMYGDAVAISEIATWVWPRRTDVAREFREKAEEIRARVEAGLWDEAAGFYKTRSRGADPSLTDVRELVGFVPWYFNLPNSGREAAWKQLIDPQGFRAAYGPTTAERRHPRFMFANAHECLWNGPSWPFATSQTLTAMANLLNNYRQDHVSRHDYLELLQAYARAHHLKRPDGKVVPFIDEDLDPDSGEWIARNRLYGMPEAQQTQKGGKDRGRDYNHSTFNDLIITGLVGLRPRMDHRLEINPLIPEGSLEYFRLERVRYHDHDLTILYDRTGSHYGQGPGLRVSVDGREIGSAPTLTALALDLPPTSGGWRKYEGNPVIGGGALGTVFDVAVLAENGAYRMWGSWRPRRSLALFESADGIHWGDPEIVLSPRPQTTWEDDVNRPTVLRRPDGYHMWYTGQAHGQSYIGYATSPDGRSWTRAGDRPVVSPELPWEQKAVMCPNVIWDESARLFRMWYSAGDQYEPDAIGYATSTDGLHWTKHPGNPVFRPDAGNLYEQHKVTGAQVFRRDGWYTIAYIGFRDTDHAQIALARSRDGITGWQRHPGNPIIRPSQDGFDHDACYKPYMVFDGKRWLLWYNGRHGDLERIGLATLEGADLGFDQ